MNSCKKMRNAYDKVGEGKRQEGRINMNERKYDYALNIHTVGIREQPQKVADQHNRYEATPYKALERLIQVFDVKPTHHLIDFGCGRGRTMFFIHHHFDIPVVGIEANDDTFEEALSNYESYLRIAKDATAPIQFLFGLAEDFEIEQEANLFYFFNPFSLKIFKKVIYNILRSVKETPRTAEIIFYYPLPEFQRFLKEHTPFVPVQEINIPGIHGQHGKFIIYRYDGIVKE